LAATPPATDPLQTNVANVALGLIRWRAGKEHTAEGGFDPGRTMGECHMAVDRDGSFASRASSMAGIGLWIFIRLRRKRHRGKYCRHCRCAALQKGTVLSWNPSCVPIVLSPTRST
jgi:hypothetical protein